MTPEALATALIGSAALGLIFGYIIGKTRADGLAFDERDAARRERDQLREACEADRRQFDRLTAERDEALRQKASQFETWQAESTNLRADVAALERKCEAMKTDRDRFWSHLDATRDRLASAESDLRAAYAEIALLRPIADSAEKFMDGNHLPGEWAEVRAAIRARKEAGNG